jgi:hypothetical protein
LRLTENTRYCCRSASSSELGQSQADSRIRRLGDAPTYLLCKTALLSLNECFVQLPYRQQRVACASEFSNLLLTIVRIVGALFHLVDRWRKIIMATPAFDGRKPTITPMSPAGSVANTNHQRQAGKRMDHRRPSHNNLFSSSGLQPVERC